MVYKTGASPLNHTIENILHPEWLVSTRRSYSLGWLGFNADDRSEMSILRNIWKITIVEELVNASKKKTDQNERVVHCREEGSPEMSWKNVTGKLTVLNVYSSSTIERAKMIKFLKLSVNTSVR